MLKKRKTTTKKKLSVDELIGITASVKENLCGPLSKRNKVKCGQNHYSPLCGTIAVSEDKLLDAVRKKRNRKSYTSDDNGDLHGDWRSEAESCVSALSHEQSLHSLATSHSFVNALSNGSISSRLYYFNGMPGPPKSVMGGSDGGFDGEMSMSGWSLSSSVKTNNVAQLYGKTLRELVIDIEDRAKKNLPTRDHITSLSDMPPSMFSWKGYSHYSEAPGTSVQPGMISSSSDSKINKNTQMLPPLHSKPIIDIIPCHQPIELVLAKANDRSRKQVLVSLNKDAREKSHAKRIQTLINQKSDKVEEFKRLSLLRLLQTNWVKIIYLNGYISRLYETYRKMILRKRMNLLYINSANVLKKFVKFWREKINENRYGMFFRMMSNNNWRMAMQVRILHKRYSARRIVNFLTLCKGQKQIATVVHRFIKNVKLSQKYARAFIISKRARLEVLVTLFDKLERSYIRSILNRKKNQTKNGAIVSQGTMEILKLDPQLKIEMKKQDNKWEGIDAKMDMALQKHRNAGALATTSSDNDIEKFMLPSHVKRSMLQHLIEKNRKEHLLSRVELIKKLQHLQSEYNIDDVHCLLAGVPIPEKSSTYEIPQAPFLLFTKINPKKIAEFIRYTHEKARTFAVYAKQNSNLGMMGLAAVAAATTAMEESAADNDGTLAPMLGRSNKQLSAMSLANSDAAVAECMESVKEGRKKNMSKYCTKKAPGYRKPKKQT